MKSTYLFFIGFLCIISVCYGQKIESYGVLAGTNISYFNYEKEIEDFFKLKKEAKIGFIIGGYINYNIFSNIIDSAGLSVPNFIIPVTELDNCEFNKYESTLNFEHPFYIGKNPLINILLKI